MIPSTRRNAPRGPACTGLVCYARTHEEAQRGALRRRRRHRVLELDARSRPAVHVGLDLLPRHRRGGAARNPDVPDVDHQRLLHPHVRERRGLLRGLGRVQGRLQGDLRAVRVDADDVLFLELRSRRHHGVWKRNDGPDRVLPEVRERVVHVPLDRRRRSEQALLRMMISDTARRPSRPR